MLNWALTGSASGQELAEVGSGGRFAVLNHETHAVPALAGQREQFILYEFDNFSVAGLELPGRVTLLGHPTVGVFVIYVGFPPLQL